jgi:hypothetical protein
MSDASMPLIEDYDSRVRLDEHYYHGTTIDILNHIGQIGRAGQFQLYDYGPEENMERYGSEAPSRVPIENINVPLAVFGGKFTSIFGAVLSFLGLLLYKLYNYPILGSFT